MKSFAGAWFLGKVLCVIILLSAFAIPCSVYSKMYLWKDEQGVFNASEARPGWWPVQSNCIAWVPGKENKVVDFVLTQKKATICELEVEEEKKDEGKIIKKKIAVEPEPVKEVIEPTDEEVRIYCAYRKSLMRFLDVPNTEEAAAEHVSEEYGITGGELQAINTKVVDFKGGDYKCVY
ncbi:MAG: hypothetical protein WGN25_12965 [Candidatus Electrothrix sp. GW3-4]|uniref:hypothetical protein n=1 Tax=Candidatus Electrothrix sp. GW3-4 TaxID=3126740 RepID=UPI0030D591D2